MKPARPQLLRALSLALLFALAVTAGACSKDKSSSGPPPARPATGAPATFVVDKIEPEALHLRVYNFSDKKIGQWGIVMRYYDADGKVLKVKPGTPFEKDFDFYSMSGNKYAVAPASWGAMTVDHLEVPAGAAKAEVLASRLKALKADGMTFEDEPVWQLEDHGWPDAATTN